MAFAGALLAGLSVAVCLRVFPRRLHDPPFGRENHRGNMISAVAGGVLIVPVLGGWIWARTGETSQVADVMAWVGVALFSLGLLDDVFGDRSAAGLLGHLRALLNRRLTTGAVKAVGGAALGLAAGWALGWRGWMVIIAGGVVAMSSNLANLLDVRPGRTLKVAIPVAIVLVAVGIPGTGQRPIIALVGGAAAFEAFDLRERVMLGDTGAGLVGGVIGVAVVASSGEAVVWIVFGVLLSLHLVAEVTTFSRVIDATPPLRWLDRAGRMPM